MEFEITVYRNDETEDDGKTFDSVKKAHDSIKKRADKEGKLITDYQIKVKNNE